MCSFQFFIYTLHILIKGYPIMGFKGSNSLITCTCMMFLNYILTCDIEHNSLKMMFLTISVLHPLSFSKTVLIGKDWSVIFFNPSLYFRSCFVVDHMYPSQCLISLS